MRYLFVFICVAALGVMGCGETEGTDGGGGSAGTGGEVQNIGLTKCALNGYGELEALWSTTRNIIHYIHDVQPLDSKIKQQLAALPDLDALPPIEELNDGTPKPRVLWSTFSLNLEPNQTQPEREIKVHVYQGLDEGIYGKEDDPATLIDESFPRGFSVDDGLYQGRIAVLDWRIDDVKDVKEERGERGERGAACRCRDILGRRSRSRDDTPESNILRGTRGYHPLSRVHRAGQPAGCVRALQRSEGSRHLERQPLF